MRARFCTILWWLAKRVAPVSVETVALVGEMAREVDLLAAVGITSEEGVK